MELEINPELVAYANCHRLIDGIQVEITEV